jgi:hypothetical protein
MSTFLTPEQCAVMIGPPGDKRVEDCKRGIEVAEVEEYLVESNAGAGLLVPKSEGIGYDLWYIRYSVPNSSVEPKYKIFNHISLAMRDEDTLVYETLPIGDVISVDILLESTRRAIGYDFITEKRVYESRSCATEDVGYALMHTLADLDQTYASLLQEYEDRATWFTAISLFLYVSTTLLAMEDVEITEEWVPIHKNLLKEFQDGSLVEGDRDELDTFVETIGSLLLLIRKRLAEL